jgi:transcription elongation factor GreA
MSSDIKKKLEEEIQVLEKELREELPRALKTAAALGDLSENADYSAARERQDFVRVRLGQLKQRLADLSMINFDKIPRDRISLGSRVVLLDVDKNEEITYRLVTSEDADAAKGLISTTSPIGRSLLNKREGDTVDVKIPAGTRPAASARAVNVLWIRSSICSRASESIRIS